METRESDRGKLRLEIVSNRNPTRRKCMWLSEKREVLTNNTVRCLVFVVHPRSWGYSSVGRAPALQAGGHEFESHYLHQRWTNHRNCTLKNEYYNEKKDEKTKMVRKEPKQLRVMSLESKFQ